MNSVAELRRIHRVRDGVLSSNSIVLVSTRAGNVLRLKS